MPRFVRPISVENGAVHLRSAADGSGMANGADACIGLRPACAAGGFFQFVVGYYENEKFFFFGWLEGAIHNAGMNVHRNRSRHDRPPHAPLPLAPFSLARRRCEHNPDARMAD